MSTDDFGDRTQRPTDRRRREARARGDVARSVDMVSALVLLTAAAALWWLGPSLGTELAGLMRSGLSATPPASFNQGMVVAQLIQIAVRLAQIVLPVLLMIAAAAIAANLLQTGFLWVPSAVLPQLERLNPATGLGRWFALHSWVGLFWSLIKLAVLLGVLVFHVRNRLASAGPLADGSPAAIFSLAPRLMGELAFMLSLSLVTLAILDYGYQFWRRERQLMMTVEEVRREHREDEGDPRLKRSRATPATGSATDVRRV